jgi:hypothetical protein
MALFFQKERKDYSYEKNIIPVFGSYMVHHRLR